MYPEHEELTGITGQVRWKREVIFHVLDSQYRLAGGNNPDDWNVFRLDAQGVKAGVGDFQSPGLGGVLDEVALALQSGQMAMDSGG